MTDNRATQLSIEEFVFANPPAQVTQVVIEQWSTVANASSGLAMVTQVALEQWAQIPPPLLGGGNNAPAIMIGA